MAASPAFKGASDPRVDELVVGSHRGPYRVRFALDLAPGDLSLEGLAASSREPGASKPAGLAGRSPAVPALGGAIGAADLAGRSPAVPALAGAIGAAGLAGQSPAVPALAGAIGAAGRAHYLVDAKVLELHGQPLSKLILSDSVHVLEATERAKSLERFPGYVERLVAAGVRRGDALVAVGGGIIQDITCFLAATLLRGLDWHFVPTTLLAQADSCIGSKSSINVGDAKNILGTFTPPKTVLVAARFLDTLDDKDARSGVGEMLKVHAIDGAASFDRIARDYERLFRDREVLLGYIRRSLEIKKRLIELDEFDRGPRNVMNYGHTFGHAIESATRFEVPHGIAVALGMDMANFVAARTGRMAEAHHRRMHGVLRRNYAGFERHLVPFDAFLSAIAKDKKNTSDRLGLILPDADACPVKVLCAPDAGFKALCDDYFKSGREP